MSVYATNAARIAALYRLPIRAAPSRTLIVKIAGSRSCEGEAGLPAEAAHLAVSADQLLSAGSGDLCFQGLSDGAYDLVVLHRALNDIGAGACAGRRRRLQLLLLRQAQYFLAPGGYVAGCFGGGSVGDSASPLHRVRSAVTALTSMGSCARLLRDANLRDTQVFLALPTADAPKILVSGDKSTASRLLRQITVRQPGLRGGIMHAVRIALIESGVELHRHRSVFFWGRKLC